MGISYTESTSFRMVLDTIQVFIALKEEVLACDPSLQCCRSMQAQRQVTAGLQLQPQNVQVSHSLKLSSLKCQLMLTEAQHGTTIFALLLICIF